VTRPDGGAARPFKQNFTRGRRACPDGPEYEQIPSHFGEKLAFHSTPLAKVMANDPAGVSGKTALRDDQTGARALAPQPFFEPGDSLPGSDALAIRYTAHHAGLVAAPPYPARMAASPALSRPVIEAPYPSNGSRIRMTSSRSGEVETSAQGLPTSSSRRRT
jgi:hypothetical protein